MIISTNWLKKYTDIDLPIDELTTLIGARLVEIEEVVALGGKYQDVLVARIVECERLENSDHLNVTKLDDGGVAEDVERDERGYVQVVCGAPNVKAGMLVVWLPPRSVVPETYDDETPFVLGARKLRGVMSNGMIASARELDLFDEHEGILEIDEDAVPGSKFAEVYELNDYLLDIENKSLTHRPDAFGIVGFAREVAAIQGKKFTTPGWLADLAPTFGEKHGEAEVPRVTIDNPELSDRYQAVVLSNANGNAKSPVEIQKYLSRVGIRPINAIVDITNYLMVLAGQPLHAFDYDKVVAVGGSADIHVRAGREKETLELLDGRTIELTSEDIVIAAGETAIGLAGAMGGATTEIDESTKTIILESATFNLYNLRATQMRHGIFSEAITRFTKGQPAELTAPVLAKAIEMMGEFAGAVRVSDVAESYPSKREQAPVSLPVAMVNDVLGSQFAAEDVALTLENVEFSVSLSDDNLQLSVTPPYWRADIHIAEDVIEEVGRLNGFDSIAPALAMRDFTAVRPSNFDALRSEIRKILVRAGANEVLTYSFVHGDVLKKASQDVESSYRLTNSISPELQYYRQSLTPSLLKLVHPNIKKGYEQFALFELNQVHSKTAELVDGVPAELPRLGLVVSHKKAQQGAPYYQAKSLLEYLGNALGLELVYKPFADESSLAIAKPFELKRSARVADAISGQPIGIVGEYKKSVLRNFKLPEYTAGFELLTEGIALATAKRKNAYTPISRYPGTERDICFQVSTGVSYQQVRDAAEAALRDALLETSVLPVDIYQAENSETKNITIRVVMTAHDRTLTNEDANAVMDRVVESVADAANATVI